MLVSEKMVRRYLLALSLLLSTHQLAHTQKVLVKARLRPPASTGYQDVVLPPVLNGYLNAEGGNLRVLDSTGSEVPYLIHRDAEPPATASVNWLTRLRQDYYRRWYTSSVFQNPGSSLVDHMVLKIRNADVRQEFTLSGSDDLSRWYVIHQDYSYDRHWDPQAGYNLLTINFPPVDYRYFKVELEHHWHEPIQIMGAGYIRWTGESGRYVPVPDPKVENQHQEAQRQTRVDIRFDQPYYADELYLAVDGPEMYLRHARLEIVHHDPDGHERAEFLQDLDLDSRTVPVVELDHLRFSHLRLIIDNKDDKPLNISAVKARQSRWFITAKLERKAPYILEVGPMGQRSPEYDLAHFEDRLPQRRREVQVDTLLHIAPVAPVVVREPMSGQFSDPKQGPAESGVGASAEEAAPTGEDRPWTEQPALLWGGMIVILIFVGLMAYRILNEKEEES